MKTNVSFYNCDECEINNKDIIIIKSNNSIKMLAYLVDNECCDYLLDLNNMEMTFLSPGDTLIEECPQKYQVYYYIKEEVLEEGEVIISVKSHEEFTIEEN